MVHQETTLHCFVDMELGHIAWSLAVQEIVFLRKFFQCLHVTSCASEAVLVYCDSMTAFACNKDLKYHGANQTY